MMNDLVDSAVVVNCLHDLHENEYWMTLQVCRVVWLVAESVSGARLVLRKSKLHLYDLL